LTQGNATVNSWKMFEEVGVSSVDSKDREKNRDLSNYLRFTF